MVNKSFEASNAEPTKLLEDLLNLLKSLVNRVTGSHSTFRLLEDKIEDFIDKNCYLGYLFEMEIKKMRDYGYSRIKETDLRSRCINFLVVVINEIKNRIFNLT